MNRILIFFLLILSNFLLSQSEFKLKVSGDVSAPLELSLSDLKKMPRVDAILWDKKGNSFVYNGVSLHEILVKAGVPSGKELHGAENLSKYVLIKCADGYQVLFSLAELDPSIQDKKVIVADLINGEPLFEDKGPLKIIAEGEKKTARSSFQVIEIIVGQVK